MGTDFVGATPASPVERGSIDAGDAGVAPTNTAALLTAPAPAAIAVIRLTGPAVADFAARHLSKPPRLRRCVHCDLRDGDDMIDDIVAVLVEEHRLDLNVHGGPWVVEATLRLAERGGFTRTDWQQAAEATDDIEAEVAAALPFARTREALACLLAQPAAWEKLLAEPDGEAIGRAIDDRFIRFLLEPPTIIILGEPNAGKSTLINRLAGQARSIVADVPGTTRDYVTTVANLDGLVCQLIDTPGQRETDDAIEAQAIHHAQRLRRSADLIVELRDATRPPAPMKGLHDPLIVWNKCDRAIPPSDGHLAISAETGEGVTELIEKIFSRLALGDIRSLHARCWTARQKELLLSSALRWKGH